MTARAKARACCAGALTTLTLGLYAALTGHATDAVIGLIIGGWLLVFAVDYQREHRRIVAACEQARHAANGRPLNTYERAQWQQIAAQLSKEQQ